MQDGSDKQHKKVRVLDLVTCLGFILSALPRLGLTQLQSAGHLSLYHGLVHLNLELWTVLNSTALILQRKFIVPLPKMQVRSAHWPCYIVGTFFLQYMLSFWLLSVLLFWLSACFIVCLCYPNADINYFFKLNDVIPILQYIALFLHLSRSLNILLLYIYVISYTPRLRYFHPAGTPKLSRTDMVILKCGFYLRIVTVLSFSQPSVSVSLFHFSPACFSAPLGFRQLCFVLVWIFFPHFM